ncbi:hypothetical protein [Vacuolonema iberomarrocanum]|uniref:hypothetical protein n=1 Tax=Vacuolonema iberomarrocanum TaxID=3454632 RepID=UPI001A0F5297|nr:hypothetical protein [filamentous cyanobacterium LEGE 07170]
MTTLKLTLDWQEATSDLPPELQEQKTQNLYTALRQLPDLERVERCPDPDVPVGSMGEKWLPSTLQTVLQTEVIPGSIGGIVNAIRQRLPGTPVSFEIEVENRKGRSRRISMNGVRPEDFDETLRKLKEAAKELADE